MPLALGLAGLVALLVFLKERNANAATNPAISNPYAVPSMADLQPGAAQYLPPVLAPDWVRVTFANAMASGNPMQMVAAANQINAAAPELAHSLSMAYQQITNNPIPGVAGVGAWPQFGQFGPFRPPMIAPQHLGAPAFAPQRALDPHTIRTLVNMAKARKVRRTADLHRALMQAASRRNLQNT